MLLTCIKKVCFANFSQQKRLFFSLLIISVIFVLSSIFTLGNFVSTNRDTALPPGTAVFQDVPMYEYAFMGQFGTLRYYFRQDRDIILIEDVYGRFSWRTGLDAAFGVDLPDIIAAAQTEEELHRVAEPLEARLNATWTALANSLITVEYFDSAFNIMRISSASRSGASSNIVEVSTGHFRLDVDFYEIDLFIPVHIFLSDVGLTYHISHEEILGSGVNDLAAIILSPFMGAAGGVRSYFDFELMRHGDPEPVPMIPGYVLVPDGSGGLIRFMENSVSFSPYVGDVFGANRAEAQFFNNSESISGITRLDPTMPVFGVTHGYNQQAFVAWANSGAEFMEIIMSPHNDMTWYNFVYPRFVKNQVIHQVYNRRGDGFFRLFPENRQFDITIEYKFLHGEDANYVGMARAYRNHLIEQGILTPNVVSNNTPMPLRLDFIMSDVRRSVMGRTNVVTTTANQVENILLDLHEAGVSSINSGLMGFQRGGVTTGRPNTINFSRGIGTRRNFTNLFRNMNEMGFDVSFAQDYFHINSYQLNLSRNQAFHMNRWGLTGVLSYEPFLPVNEISFARPSRSAQWLTNQSSIAIGMGANSVTVSGITNNLTSHWERQNPINTHEAINILQEAFRDVDAKINADAPNIYLWKYVDRFLNTPVFNNQHMITTDTVPFLQLVLFNTMEMYAPYSNFSFYNRRDVLRMIDYGVFPSFVVTHSPAHYLSNTNSFNFYSTEFNIFRDRILEVYFDASEILSQIIGLEWLNRQVISDGVVLNTYSGGVLVLINYTDYDFILDGEIVPPLTARLFS